MNTQLVQEAVDLFIETLPLDTIDINIESAKWHDLYSKECKIFDLFRLMTDEEMVIYREKVAVFDRN